MTPVSNIHVLIADDDEALSNVLAKACVRQGWKASRVGDAADLEAALSKRLPDVLVCDVMMPMHGRAHSNLDLLPKLRGEFPQLPVIVISARSTLQTAVRAAESGAFEYIPKPFDLNVLIATIEKAVSATPQAPESSVDHSALENAGLVGKSPAMQEIYRTLARVTKVDLTVMIIGQSGTGKELVARALHQFSARSKAPFIALNVAAIPKELVESELFGYEKGAFTGAVNRKDGAFARAEGGTLFLDEIGDMPMSAQTSLLRVLQQGEFSPLGSTRTQRTHVRVVCATHHDLMQRVEQGNFREDLYYRLNVVPIHVPPLCERAQDMDELTQHLLAKARTRGLPAKTLDPAAVEALKAYDWPGNVRELEHVLYRLCALVSEPVLSADHVRRALQAAVHSAVRPAESGPRDSQLAADMESEVHAHLERYFHAHGDALPPSGLWDRILPLVERPLIALALQATQGNQLRAAELLGINRNTLRKKMRELGIDEPTRRRA